MRCYITPIAAANTPAKGLRNQAFCCSYVRHKKEAKDDRRLSESIDFRGSAENCASWEASAGLEENSAVAINGPQAGATPRTRALGGYVGSSLPI
jgi:hypothetical protein